MQLTEDELVAAITRVVSGPAPGVRVGIGDDAALATVRTGELALTTDLLVEGSHFERRLIAPRDLGYKAIAVNLSDLAAMGASPRFALVSLGLPAAVDAAWVVELYGGMVECSSEYAVSIVGGDLSRARETTISVTLVGEVPAGRAVLRSGASAGERIAVTGTLGASAAGLLLSRSPKDVLSESLTAGWGRQLLHAHERPTPRIGEGETLALSGATAMMDLSDGLSRDLPRLCRASGVGAAIRADRVPVAPALAANAKRLGIDPLDVALSGGEDYELLAVLPAGVLDDAAERLRDRFGVALTEIGETTAPEGITILGDDGEERPLEPKGWDHFARD
jgi:thiamine-monophosphate kinase